MAEEDRVRVTGSSSSGHKPVRNATRPAARRTARVGMVIGKEPEGDHGTILPRDFSQDQLQIGKRYMAVIGSSKPRVAFLCTRWPVAARLCVLVRFFWSGVDVALM